MTAQDLRAELQQSDELDRQGEYIKEKALLLAAEKKEASGIQKAEIYWRLARVVMNITEENFNAKRLSVEQALKQYEAGESYANVAIQNNPKSAPSYFWKSANMGMWGQTKGILDSLFKAGPMNDNLRLALTYDPLYADAYYVLGELYEKLPGWPISFGNVEYSVSLGRRAIDIMEKDLKTGVLQSRSYSQYISLASHLWNRNWDAVKRQSMKPELQKQFHATSNAIDKYFFYEGTVTIKNISDRTEAKEILQMIIKELESLSSRTIGQNSDLKEAKEKLAEFK
ncbi:MAG: hypothetical protein JW904_11815 [Spirochaetales bacterium]|nr:hypothetical protein [Spirochaetales bacterium]